MPSQMTTEQFKSLRRQMGLSQAGLAEALSLGDNGARTIQRIEGGAPITGPMALAVQKLASDASNE